MSDENLNANLLEFQKRFSGVEKNRNNTFTNSKYANLSDIWNAAKPLLSDLELLAKDEISISDGRTILKCSIEHIPTGESFSSECYLDDDKGAQIFGSELTYKRRYLKCTMLNIVETEDDDGNAGSMPANPNLTEKQHSQILDLIDATETDMNKFVDHLNKVYSVDEISLLTIKQASTAINQLKAKLNRVSKNG